MASLRALVEVVEGAIEVVAQVPAITPAPGYSISFSWVLSSISCALIGGAMACMTAYRHLACLVDIKLQTYVTRIVLIVPIIVAEILSILFFASWLPGLTLVFVVARDLWEALVIDTFLSFILESTGGEIACARAMAIEPGVVSHLPPINWIVPHDGWQIRFKTTSTKVFMLQYLELIFEEFRHGVRRTLSAEGSTASGRPPESSDSYRWEEGYSYYTVAKVVPCTPVFVKWCKRGTLQFVITKPLMAFLTVIVFLTGLDGRVWQIIELAVYNVSYSVALYSLCIFYTAVKYNPQLAPIKPLRKFLAVKLVVFATFWQNLIFTLFAQINNFIYDYSGGNGTLGGNMGAARMTDEYVARVGMLVLGLELPLFAGAIAWAYPLDEFTKKLGQSTHQRDANGTDNRPMENTGALEMQLSPTSTNTEHETDRLRFNQKMYPMVELETSRAPQGAMTSSQPPVLNEDQADALFWGSQPTSSGVEALVRQEEAPLGHSQRVSSVPRGSESPMRPEEQIRGDAANLIRQRSLNLDNRPPPLINPRLNTDNSDAVDDNSPTKVIEKSTGHFRAFSLDDLPFEDGTCRDRYSKPRQGSQGCPAFSAIEDSSPLVKNPLGLGSVLSSYITSADTKKAKKVFLDTLQAPKRVGQTVVFGMVETTDEQKRSHAKKNLTHVLNMHDIMDDVRVNFAGKYFDHSLINGAPVTASPEALSPHGRPSELGGAYTCRDLGPLGQGGNSFFGGGGHSNEDLAEVFDLFDPFDLREPSLEHDDRQRTHSTSPHQVPPPPHLPREGEGYPRKDPDDLEGIRNDAIPPPPPPPLPPPPLPPPAPI